MVGAFDKAWSVLKNEDKATEVMEIVSQNANDPDFMEYLGSTMGILSMDDVTSNLNDPNFVDYIHRILVGGPDFDDETREFEPGASPQPT